jgi:glycosyltransferase involved in cell wall biosynthesis
VGRVDREKALDVLIQAVADLDRADIQLAIAGQGSFLNDLQALSRRLALGRRVVFTGYVSNDDLPLLLNSADVFVMPSRAELQSIATLEAMSSGLPVLAADARALPELVAPGVNGYLFEVGQVAKAAQGLAFLGDNRERWAAMGLASLSKAKPHSLANTIYRYADLYGELFMNLQPVKSGIPRTLLQRSKKYSLSFRNPEVAN